MPEVELPTPEELKELQEFYNKIKEFSSNYEMEI